jgi:hypothetical protein
MIDTKNLLKLNDSLLFNISLSSKELFHSNFLAFIFEKIPNLFGKIIGKENLVIKRIKREYRNIDIFIICNNDETYIIENKIKDVAKDEQLAEIYSKSPDCSGYYLFSLLGNNINNKKNNNWKEIGYKYIINTLRKMKTDSDYINNVLNDYCNFMQLIITTFDKIFSRNKTYLFYYKGNDIIKPLIDIRMHDLFMKYGMSQFVNYFNEKYNKNNKIIVSYAIFRAQPTMTFAKIYKGYNVRVEIGDIFYKKGIICKKESELFYFEKKGWLNKDYRSSTGRKYLQYDLHEKGVFYYQILNRNIENIKYDMLSKYIIKDLNIT